MEVASILLAACMDINFAESYQKPLLRGMLSHEMHTS